MTTDAPRVLWGLAATAAEAAGTDATNRPARELWATAADHEQRAATVGTGRV